MNLSINKKSSFYLELKKKSYLKDKPNVASPENNIAKTKYLIEVNTKNRDSWKLLLVELETTYARDDYVSIRWVSVALASALGLRAIGYGCDYVLGIRVALDVADRFGPCDRACEPEERKQTCHHKILVFFSWYFKFSNKKHSIKSLFFFTIREK